MNPESRNRKRLLVIVLLTSFAITILYIAHFLVGIFWLIQRRDSNGRVSISVGFIVFPELILMGIAIYKKNYKLAVISLICLAVALLLDLVLMVVASREVAQLYNKDKYRDQVIKQIYVESSRGNEDSRKKVDIWQSTKMCCGYNGTSDPELVKDNVDGLLLDSCCAKNVVRCTPAHAFQDACTLKIIEDITYSTRVLLPLSTIFAFVSLIRLIMFIPLIMYLYSIRKRS